VILILYYNQSTNVRDYATKHNVTYTNGNIKHQGQMSKTANITI